MQSGIWQRIHQGPDLTVDTKSEASTSYKSTAEQVEQNCGTNSVITGSEEAEDF